MNSLSVKDRLDSFRDRFAGCSVVVFADVSTGMVLSASSRERTTQEKLDDLCRRAASRLAAGAHAGVSNRFFGANGLTPSLIEFDAAQRFCIVRSNHADEEALCFLHDGPEPVSEMLAVASELLSDIGAEG
ncbi:hypothetical protein ACOTTU_06495 [Roseobacter sp. EG26]|uniref:hypothetical protein n=1 Tax=Roseobacter sp. EG26 TaxID=3412477 RepID=UPI003CE49D02